MLFRSRDFGGEDPLVLVANDIAPADMLQFKGSVSLFLVHIYMYKSQSQWSFYTDLYCTQLTITSYVITKTFLGYYDSQNPNPIRFLNYILVLSFQVLVHFTLLRLRQKTENKLRLSPEMYTCFRVKR